MIGRKGRQECLPPSQECLQSYICKPANYQPPALIELLFDNLIARQGPNPAPKGQSPLTRFLFHQAFQRTEKFVPPYRTSRVAKARSPLLQARVPASLARASADLTRVFCGIGDVNLDKI